MVCHSTLAIWVYRSIPAVTAAYGLRRPPVGAAGRRSNARDGLSFNAGYLGVHIHSCGNGCYWFRPYGESLGRAPSNQGLLPPSFGASPRLGMPSLRSCSVGPPRPAIHGLTRLTRHPAGLPTAQNLLSASRRAKRSKAQQKPKRGELTLDLIAHAYPVGAAEGCDLLPLIF
jgi:hypothetical protein